MLRLCRKLLFSLLLFFFSFFLAKHFYFLLRDPSNFENLHFSPSHFGIYLFIFFNLGVLHILHIFYKVIPMHDDFLFSRILGLYDLYVINDFVNIFVSNFLNIKNQIPH